MAEHVSITDPQIHEPKGVSSADEGHVYIADGLGSGDWKLPGGSVFGEMEVINNSTIQALSAASDATLNTATDYVKVDSGIWTVGEINNMTFDATNDKLIIPVTGTYRLNVWLSFKMSVLTTLAAFRFSWDDTNDHMSVRRALRLSGNAGDVGSVSMSIFRPLIAGDTVSLFVAADKAVNLTVVEAGINVVLMKEE